MSNVRFELNTAGVGELLRSEAMQEILSDYAEQVRGRCTAGEVGVEEYETSTSVRGTRAVSTVRAATYHARNSNLKHNTLLKALGGGG